MLMVRWENEMPMVIAKCQGSQPQILANVNVQHVNESCATSFDIFGVWHQAKVYPACEVMIMFFWNAY